MSKCRLARIGFGIRNWVFLICIFCIGTFSYGKVTVDGVCHYSLKEVASKLKLRLEWNAQNEEVILTGPNIRMSFLNKKRYVIINNIQVWLGMPIFLNKKELYVSESDFLKAIAPVVVPCNYSMPPRFLHVVIDAGHGGSDEGTSNGEYNVKEKDLALDVSLRLKKELEQGGCRVTLTRGKDQYIALKDRPDFANEVDADMFISVHFNSVENGRNSVQGIETYVLSLAGHRSTSSHLVNALDEVSLPGNRNDPWNILLGYSVQNSLIKNLKAVDRGVRRSRFAVLKTLNCPGILVEAGFLSHPEECRKISSPVYRQKIAESIAGGVFGYQRALNRIRERD